MVTKLFDATKFWEWCGFTLKERREYNKADYASFIDGYDWTSPDGEILHLRNDTPTIDLNNLFRWAVPKFYSVQIMTSGSHLRPSYHVSLVYKTKDNKMFRIVGAEADLAIALMNAIWEIICGVKEK